MLKLKLSKLFWLSCVFMVFPIYLNASDCNRKAFDIKIDNDETSAYEVISQLSKVCNFSIVYKDNYAKNALQIKQDGISIKNMHIKDVFDLLIVENGLNYDFTGKILRIKGLETKTFKISYITSIRKGSAITKANVESQSSSSSSDGDGSSSGSGSSDNMIETTEEFDFWKNIGQEVTEIINNSGLNVPTTPPTINSNAGLITVTSNKETLKKVERYLKEVEESLKKQVIIDVSIIEVALNKSHKTGIDWTQFNLGFDTTRQNAVLDEEKGAWIYPEKELIVTNPVVSASTFTTIRGASDVTNFWGRVGLNLTGMMNFLKESGDVKVVSSPKIATLNNQQALITVGETYNYKLKGSSTTTESGSTGDADEEKSIFVGILLNILPEISDDNKIMLRINPSISELLNPEDARVRSTGENSKTYREIAPDTKQKKISTVVQVRDGETIVLGGLITDSEMFSRNGVPILQDIPLLGHIFGSKKKVKNKSELVFIITPRIVDFTKDKQDIKKSLADLGYDMALDYDKSLVEEATKNEVKEHFYKKQRKKDFDAIQ